MSYPSLQLLLIEKKTARVTKVVKPVLEKKAPTTKTEDSDSDSFDPVNDEEIGGYDPHGDILPSTRRIVVKGANKCYNGEFSTNVIT
jgi:hypothetical protein